MSSFFYSCTTVENWERTIINKFSSEESLDAAVEVTESFFDALVDRDFESAYQMISAEDQQSGGYEKFVQEFEDVTDIVFFEINWVEVKNNIAIVGVDFMDSYDGDRKLYKDLEVSLIKEDEQWKINFWE